MSILARLNPFSRSRSAPAGEPEKPEPTDIREVQGQYQPPTALPLRKRAAYSRLDKYLSNLLTDHFRGRQWMQDPSFSYKRDPEFVEKVWRDPVIGKAILARTQEIIGGDYYFEAPSHPQGKRMVAVYDEIFSGIRRFRETLLHWARAFFFGSEWAKVLATHEYADPARSGQKQWWWLPQQIKPMDRRRWHLEWTSDTSNAEAREYRRWYWALFNPYTGQTEIPAPLEQELFIQHVWMDEERAGGFGWGISDGLALYWDSKQTLLKYLLVGLERFAWPWLIVKTNEASELYDASLGPAHSTSRLLLSKFRKMRQAGTILIDQDDDATLLDMGTGRAIEGLLSAMRYLDKSAQEYIRSASMADGGHAGAESGGSMARGGGEIEQAHGYSTSYDGPILEETINATLIRLIFKYNRANFDALGFQGCPPPKFHLGREKRSDPMKDMQTLAALAAIPRQEAIVLKLNEVVERAGWELGSDEDRRSGNVLTLPPQPAGGAGGGAQPGGLAALLGGAQPGAPKPPKPGMGQRMTEAELTAFFVDDPVLSCSGGTDDAT